MSKDRRPTPPADSRQARLTAALRANLARRKAQARSRAEGEADGDKAAGLTPGSKNQDPAGTAPDEGASED